jgi:hypothetical protein
MNEMMIFLSQYPVPLKVVAYGGLLLPGVVVFVKMIREI